MSILINAVNFPDEAFRNYISTHFDRDEDGYLSDAEIASATQISGADAEEIASLEGVKLLTGLRVVDIGYGAPNSVLETADFAGMTNLERVSFWSCSSLTAINVSGCTSLEGIYCRNNPEISSLNVTNCSSLIRIEINSTKLSSLDLTGCTSMRFLSARDNQLSSINLGGVTTYHVIRLNGNNLQSLTLPACPDLRLLHTENNLLSTVDTSQCPILAALRSNGEPTLRNSSDGMGGLCYYWRASSDRETEEDKNTETYMHQSVSTNWYIDELSVDRSVVTGHPFLIEPLQDIIADENELVTFSAQFGGTNPKYYHWAYSLDGGQTWINIGDSSSPTYTTGVNAQNNGWTFTCIAIDSTDSMAQASTMATLTVMSTPVIMTQPQNISVRENTVGQFSVTASAYELDYQWESSTDGETWTAIAECGTGAAYNITATEADAAKQYRCKISNDKGTVYTDAVTLTIIYDPPVFTVHPEDATVSVGDTVTFTASAIGKNTVFSWESKDAGESAWHAVAENGLTYQVSDATIVGENDDEEYTASISFTAAADSRGRAYRFIAANNGGSAISNEAELYVALPPVITSQPKDESVINGSEAVFYLEASGLDLSYQWQVSVDDGSTWENITDASEDAYSFITTDAMDDNLYRCVVQNVDGVLISDTASLNVVLGCAIITQPADMIVLDGRLTGFEIVAEFDSTWGEGSYQVQKKARGSDTWNDVQNADEPAYRFTAVIDMDGAQYRYALTNDSGTAYSDTISLTVLEDPVILQHPEDASVLLDDVAAFAVTSNAETANYNWQICMPGNDEWRDIDDELLAVNGYPHMELIARSSLNECRIRCQVWNQLVTYTSDAATLTISNEKSSKGIPINEYFFPDAVFRDFVAENYDTSEDGYLSDEEIDAVTEMTIGEENGSDIQDLGGVQYFTALDNLCVQGTKIRSLRLGSLALTQLTVTGNARLTALDISGCEQLVSLDCSNNNLEALDIENNAGLEKIDCHGNGITGLDLYQLTELTHLDCSGNALTEINVGACALSQYIAEHEPVTDNTNGTVTYGSIDGEAYLRCDRQTTIRNDMSVTITTPPSDADALVETEVVFAVEAEGERIQYQWQSREIDGEWEDIDGETDAEISVTVSADMDQAEYRARAYNAYSTVYSEAALLRVYDYPAITTQPQDIVTIAAREITFVIETGSYDDTYRWQVLRPEDEDWVSADSVFDTVSDVSILRITSELTMSGYKLRCIVSNPVAETVSDEVTLTVLDDPQITVQPESMEVAFGVKHSFVVEASGEMLSYQWMEKDQFSTAWTASTREGATTNTLVVMADQSTDYKQFRCVITNTFQTIMSDPATLVLITTPVITSQPQSINVAEESSVAFAVNVTGRSMTFKWQLREDAESEWRDYAGEDSANYRIRFEATAELDGYRYRCVISNIAGTAYSSEATLGVTAAVFFLSDAVDGDTSNVLPAGEYTFSLNANKEGITYSLGFGIYGDTTWLVENATAPYTFYSDGVRPIRIMLAAPRSASLSGCTIKPMLETGNTAHAWVSPTQKVHDIVNDFNYSWFSIGNTYSNVENVVVASIPCDATIKYRPIWKDTI